jgi:hypothetical protein
VVGDDPLETGVLVLQLPEMPDALRLLAVAFLLPAGVGSLTVSRSATGFQQLVTVRKFDIGLFQKPSELLEGMPLSLQSLVHVSVYSSIGRWYRTRGLLSSGQCAKGTLGYLSRG